LRGWEVEVLASELKICLANDLLNISGRQVSSSLGDTLGDILL